MARSEETILVNVMEAERAVSELLENRQTLNISISDFLRLNIHKFKNTNLSRRTIYESLTGSGLKLGTFKAFSRCWSRVEKSGVLAPALGKADSTIKINQVEEDVRHSRQEAEPERREVKREAKPEVNAAEATKQKANPALRPIYVNGVEVQIDPATGAKTFEIKSSKNK